MGYPLFPHQLGIAGIIFGRAWGSAPPPSRSMFALRLVNDLTMRVSAEQCMVDNQNDDRAHNGDQNTVKV